MAQQAVERFDAGIRLVCETFSISETCYRYQAKLSDDNALIADWLIRLTHHQKNWGFGLCFLFLRNVKRFGWNHKRVYRIYQELELNLRIKPKKRMIREKPEPLAVPETINECWSMDFMSDTLQHGHRFRTFNVLDDFNREVLGIDINSGIQATRVTQYLDQIAAWRGYPKQVRVDNGPEFTSGEFAHWAEQHGIYIDFIEPGSPY